MGKMIKLLGILNIALISNILLISIVNGQENAQRRVPSSLAECYKNRTILERDNRLPMTITTLINLIRKVEDTEGLNMDIRELAVAIVHRFKQDGIELAKDIPPSEYVLPYSPQGYQFAKHKILLSRLIPGNAQRFPNDTLSIEEQCSFHFMVSNSIHVHVRGDEATRCSSLAQYRTNRIPRAVNQNIEILKHPKNDKLSKLRQQNDEIDEYDQENDGLDDTLAPRSFDFGVDTDPNLVSACPVENGVIQTRWGPISAGTLLTGIASGLVQQTVRVSDAIVKPKTKTRAKQVGVQAIDNRWAATLSGDLAEVALRQGPKNNNIQVGAKGVS